MISAHEATLLTFGHEHIDPVSVGDIDASAAELFPDVLRTNPLRAEEPSAFLSRFV
jgi:hypothetical protein